MNKFERQIISLLADPELSERDFRDAVRYLVTDDKLSTVKKAEELRDYMRNLFGVRNTPSQVDGTSGGINNQLVGRLHFLLIKEARLGVARALEALAQNVKSDERFHPKESFRDGLRRLLKSVDESTLLSAGERIRASAIHSPKQHAWPLNKELPTDMESVSEIRSK